jgi:hypothetical protein
VFMKKFPSNEEISAIISIPSCSETYQSQYF